MPSARKNPADRIVSDVRNLPQGYMSACASAGIHHMRTRYVIDED
jgi:hypothetical protein